ncbi:MAG: polysaccharide biosynthesis protein [Proteobacteria bacterium]|nr:polysaccharide biosynthesis protein [Pseudomonadota bacterium]
MGDFKELIKTKTAAKRLLFFLFGDIILLFISAVLSIYIRFNFKIPLELQSFVWMFASLSVIVKIPILYLFRLYNISWRFVSLDEAIKLVLAITVGEFTLFIILLALKSTGIMDFLPRSVILIDFLLSMYLVGIFRLSKRLVSIVLQRKITGNNKKKTIVIGAGSAGEQIIRELLKSNNEYYPVCIIDDDRSKLGMYIHGVKIVGDRNNIEKIAYLFGCDTAIIAIPTISKKNLNEIVEILQNAGIKEIKALPSILDIVNDRVRISDIRPVKLEDLLGREEVKINMENIRKMLEGKSVMVTGAGGSIGSELCKQIARFKPRRLILFEIDETELFNITNEFKKQFPYIEIADIVGDVKNRDKVSRVMKKYHTDIVFHASAYKHVPAMEKHPDEAITNNIVGTYNVAKSSVENGVEKFILISTDKAVNPTSIMGASKRFSEFIVNGFNATGNTKFVSVRFGNVLGSRGSVIPIFEKQIKEGGPITITHPDMRRYFMLIPEACILVLEAGAIGEGGEVFVLDMGEPVRIEDVAKQMMKLYGLVPGEDIEIVYTGVRPGEKLFEELLTAEEGTDSTKSEKIYKAKQKNTPSMGIIEKYIDQLVVNKYDRNKIDEILREIIPTYKKITID